jgi:hypothetical protein
MFHDGAVSVKMKSMQYTSRQSFLKCLNKAVSLQEDRWVTDSRRAVGTGVSNR